MSKIIYMGEALCLLRRRWPDLDQCALEVYPDRVVLDSESECFKARKLRAVPAGAGTRIRGIVDALGADRARSLWKKMTGKDCTCDADQAWLDRKFPELSGWFDRVYVLSLQRTPERLTAFLEKNQSKWPFAEPWVYAAVDGQREDIPAWFRQGGPAWGCRQSHIGMLRDFLSGKARHVLIFEDDAEVVEDCTERIVSAIRSLPAKWENLMLGGQAQNDGSRREIGKHLDRVTQFERTHAYAFSRDGAASFLEYLERPIDGHCDWLLGDWQEKHQAFAIRPVVSVQMENFSTIRCRQEPSRSWDANVSTGTRNAPVCVLRAPHELVTRLRNEGLIHTGYWRSGDDVDHGIHAGHYAKTAIWLKGEAGALEKAAAVLWHPSQEIEVPGIPTVQADVYEDAVQKLRRLNPVVGEVEVFYHVAAMNNWSDVVHEQLIALSGRGLVNVNVAFLGRAEDLIFFQETARSLGMNAGIVYTSERMDDYEIPALRKLWEWSTSQKMARPVLYLHTKGVSVPDDANKQRWRRLMQKWIVSRWTENVNLLQRNDLVGVDWQDSPDLPHFSGNFWMVRSDWVSQLADPVAWQQSRNDVVCGQPWRRISAEMWPGSKPYHEIVSLGCRNENLWSGPRVFDFPVD